MDQGRIGAGFGSWCGAVAVAEGMGLAPLGWSAGRGARVAVL